MTTVGDMVQKVTTIHKETGTHPTSVTMPESDYRDMCRSHAQDILDCNTVVERILYNVPRRLVTDEEVKNILSVVCWHCSKMAEIIIIEKGEINGNYL